jgi:flagellar secretion chaperone FliS
MSFVAQSQTAAPLLIAPFGVDAAVVSYSWDLMLFDRIAERVADARDAVEVGLRREKHRLLTTAVQIVGELRSSLNVRGGDPLAANMCDLCDYLCRQLAAANLQNRVATLDEVSHLLREARIAWVMLPSEARVTHAAGIRE